MLQHSPDRLERVRGQRQIRNHQRPQNLYFPFPLFSAPSNTKRSSLDVTGPATATKALLFIYDIFGYFPQTVQGADILASSDEHSPYLIFMPDWFEGQPADISWYPPDTKEKGEKLGAFFQGPGAPPTTAGKIPEFV
jgi:hypothetical protein